jgi:hypothetical protein
VNTGKEDGMTREEVARFALQLAEAERIRELIASEEAALVNDEPILVALAEESAVVAA